MAGPVYLNRIKEIRSGKGLSQGELGEMVGAHLVTISKLERGKIKLTQDWIKRLSNALKVSEADILFEQASEIPLVVKGWAISGKYGDLTVTDVDAPFPDSHRRIIELHSGNEQHTWVQLCDDRLYPFAHSGDLIRFTFQDTSKYLGNPYDGRLCLLDLGKVEQRLIIGFARSGSKRNHYTLDLPGCAPRFDLKPVSIAMATLVLAFPITSHRHFTQGEAGTAIEDSVDHADPA